MGDRVRPPVIHGGESYGQLVDEISTAAVNLRTRLPTLAAIAFLVGGAALAATADLSAPVAATGAVAFAFGSAIAILVIIRGAPRLFMRSGHIRRYTCTDPQGHVWLVEDKPTTRVALPVDDGIQVIERYHGGSRKPEETSMWHVHHPAGVCGERKEAHLTFPPQHGPAAVAALRKHLPKLAIERERIISAGV